MLDRGDEVIIIIPARLKSTRLPEKVLLKETGKYLIEHTYENALRVKKAKEVYIATDSLKIAKVCRSFCNNVVLTSPKHRTGTDRIAEALSSIKSKVSMVVNIQADEPEVNPRYIDSLIDLMSERKEMMGTLVAPLKYNDLANPNLVKAFVVGNRAIFFLREVKLALDKFALARSVIYQHIGVYCYRADFLKRFVELKQTRLERLYSLEQFRAIEHNYPIAVKIVPRAFKSIDTLEDYCSFVSRFKKR